MFRYFNIQNFEISKCQSFYISSLKLLIPTLQVSLNKIVSFNRFNVPYPSTHQTTIVRLTQTLEKFLVSVICLKTAGLVFLDSGGLKESSGTRET